MNSDLSLVKSRQPSNWAWTNEHLKNSFLRSLIGLRMERYILVNGCLILNKELDWVDRFGQMVHCTKDSGATIKQMALDV